MSDPHIEAIKAAMRVVADTRCLAVLRALGYGPASFHELIEACEGDQDATLQAVQCLHDQCLIEACDDMYCLSGRVKVDPDADHFFLSVKVAGSYGFSLSLSPPRDDSWSDQS